MKVEDGEMEVADGDIEVDYVEDEAEDSNDVKGRS